MSDFMIRYMDQTCNSINNRVLAMFFPSKHRRHSAESQIIKKFSYFPLSPRILLNAKAFTKQSTASGSSSKITQRLARYGPQIPAHPTPNITLLGSANPGLFLSYSHGALSPIEVDESTCPWLQNFHQPIKIPQSLRHIIVGRTRNSKSPRSSLV